MPANCSAKNAQRAAEADKASAEAAKTDAERAKAQAEAAKATAVDAATTATSAKAQAVQDKATAEKALASAESARTQADQDKATAEAAAAAAKIAKAQALQEKATAESARAQAETTAQLAEQEAALVKKSHATNKQAGLKAVADAKQQAEQARQAKKLVEQLQKDLNEVLHVCRCSLALTHMLPDCVRNLVVYKLARQSENCRRQGTTCLQVSSFALLPCLADALSSRGPHARPCNTPQGGPQDTSTQEQVERWCTQHVDFGWCVGCCR